MKATATLVYQKLYDASEATFLMQAVGARGVRIMAVEAGAAVPAASDEGYFVLKQAPGHTNAITRYGLEGADIYYRSDSESYNGNLSHFPAAST
mgnify:CR=1 FL=1